MKIFLVLLMIIGICLPANATVFYTSNYVYKSFGEVPKDRYSKSDPNEMTTIGSPYKQSWASYKSEDSYTGIVDRKVLVSGMTTEQSNNPQDTSKVLISKPIKKIEKKEPIYIAKKEDSVITTSDVVKDESIKATTWLEDETSTTSPKDCSIVNDTLTCNAF